MERIRIKGGKSLFGELELQGAKNSALPILAAAILCESPCIIHNCPDITDVSAAVKILEYLGCKVIGREALFRLTPEDLCAARCPTGL